MRPGSAPAIGCCGWAAARARYFRELEAVEVQQTFYDPPRASTLERWRREAPPLFRFTLKCFQIVTHDAGSPTYRRLRRPHPPPERIGSFRDTQEVRAAWAETVAAARALAAEVIVVQTPARFTPCAANLARLRAFACWAVPAAQGIRIAFEPRGPRWGGGVADGICSELGLLWAGDPFVLPAPPPERSGDVYFRLHGIGGFRYRFTEADFGRLRGWLSGRRNAWVFFNHAAMWQDARRFRAFLARG